jgi:hypothetical protein
MLSCVAGVGLVLSSCGSDSQFPIGACAAPKSLAVEVTVRDSISGQAAADGAIGVLTGAAVDDTLAHADSLTLLGGDKLGTYTVTIDRPGYLTWIASDVRVTDVGMCGNVVPVKLSAKLQRATP